MIFGNVKFRVEIGSPFKLRTVASTQKGPAGTPFDPKPFKPDTCRVLLDGEPTDRTIIPATITGRTPQFVITS